MSLLGPRLWILMHVPIAFSVSEIAQGDDRLKARDKELTDHDLYQDPLRWDALNKERESWIATQAGRTSQWATLCEEAEDVRAQLKELDSQNPF